MQVTWILVFCRKFSHEQCKERLSYQPWWPLLSVDDCLMGWWHQWRNAVQNSVECIPLVSSFILLLPNNLLKLALNDDNYLKCSLLLQNLLSESSHPRHFTICTRNASTQARPHGRRVCQRLAAFSPLRAAVHRAWGPELLLMNCSQKFKYMDLHLNTMRCYRVTFLVCLVFGLILIKYMCWWSQYLIFI